MASIPDGIMRQNTPSAILTYACYGIELLNANAQLKEADGGKLVVVDPGGTEHAMPIVG